MEKKKDKFIQEMVNEIKNCIMTPEERDAARAACSPVIDLTESLMHTFRESGLYKSGSKNKRFTFDVIMALAYFAGSVLKALDGSNPLNPNSHTAYSFFKETALPGSYCVIEDMLEEEDKDISTN